VGRFVRLSAVCVLALCVVSPERTAVAQAPQPAAESGRDSSATDGAAADSSETRRNVVVVRPPAQDAARTDAFNRLWAELHIHGFAGETVEREPGDDPTATLSELATERSALAAFAFVRRDSALSLEVVLVDRTTGQTIPRRLPFAAGSSDAASLIAVRAVDLLRSSLQEFPESEPAPEPEPAGPVEPPPSAAVPDVAPREHAFSLAAEGTLIWPGKDFSVGFGPALGLLYRPLPWFQCGVWVGGVFGTSYDAATGSASVRQELGLLEARAMFLRVSGFRLGVTAGAGAFFLQATGAPRQPRLPEQDSVWSGLLAVGLHAEQSLGSDFALGLSARALALAPALGVAIAGERAKLQLPVLQVSLGLTVGF
jgi:hypothetical protein